jgi:hypothetical protein
MSALVWLAPIWNSGTGRSQILPAPLFADSDLTAGVQIADLISYLDSWRVRFQGMDLPAREELKPVAQRVL